MKTKQQASVAIEMIAHPDQQDLISRITGLDKKKLGTIERKLRKNAFLAYVPSMLEIAISSLASYSIEIKVVQVGANNGLDFFNPLVHRYASSALLLEPIPHLINEIKESYRGYDGKLVVENALITDCLNDDSLILNVLDPEFWDSYEQAVGRSATEIASVYVGPLTHKISQRLNVSLEEAKSKITKISCPKYTLENLLMKYNFADVDVLQIDCEGHDFNVIRSLGDVRPKIINFESFNFSQSQWNDWKLWARKNSYGWVQGPQDTLAIKNASFISEF